MKRIELPVNGKNYPCIDTLGAYVRFEGLAQKKVDEIDLLSIEDLSKWIWCCMAAGCNREKIPFEYSFDEFKDNVSTDILVMWKEAMSKEPADNKPSKDGQKKRVRKS